MGEARVRSGAYPLPVGIGGKAFPVLHPRLKQLAKQLYPHVSMVWSNTSVSVNSTQYKNAVAKAIGHDTHAKKCYGHGRSGHTHGATPGDQRLNKRPIYTVQYRIG